MNLRVRELTPRGAGAVSVLCFEGVDAREAVAQLASGRRFAIGSVSLARLVLDAQILDEALVCAISPQCVEVHVHGSAPLVRLILAHFASALSTNATAANAMSSSYEERCRARLAQAQTAAGARILLDQAEGALRRELEALAQTSSAERASAVSQLLARSNATRRAIEPARVVLAGTVNSGKSTLFNALCAERRAIESPEPGTTRDVLCAAIELGAYPVLLFDTAGERGLDPARTESAIEGAGQERARCVRRTAELVLWLEPDPGLSFAHVSNPRTERITSQADRLATQARLGVPTPLSARDNPGAARATIVRLFHDSLRLPRAPWASMRAEIVEDEVAAALALPDPRAAVDRCLELLGPRPASPAI